MSEESMVRQDRMRFTKNTTSSRLALLAIIFDVLFFVSIYKVNNLAYYKWLIGVSILYNLVFMLAAFLASEGVKNYKIHFSILLVILAIGQIVRIFIYPDKMFNTPWNANSELGITITERVTEGKTVKEITRENRIMESPQHIRMIIYLSLSALCLLASAVINFLKSRALTAYIANLSLQKA